MWRKGQEADREKTLQKWGYRWRKGSKDKKLVLELFWTGEERCQSRSLNLERNVCSELTMRIWNTGTMIRHILTREHHWNKQILVFIRYCLWVFRAGIIEQKRTNEGTFFLFNTNVCNVFLQKHTVNPGPFSPTPIEHRFSLTVTLNSGLWSSPDILFIIHQQFGQMNNKWTETQLLVNEVSSWVGGGEQSGSSSNGSSSLTHCDHTCSASLNTSIFDTKRLLGDKIKQSATPADGESYSVNTCVAKPVM